jgi:hypothetical protein
MANEDRLRAVIRSLREIAAQNGVDATEDKRAEQYAKATGSARAETFVRVDLPGVVNALMPKIPEVARAPVATGKDDQALNQFHGHHDWRYGFRVGQAEGIAESCEDKVEVTIQVLDRNQTQKWTLAQSDMSPERAEAFFFDVVARGIRF